MKKIIQGLARSELFVLRLALCVALVVTFTILYYWPGSALITDCEPEKCVVDLNCDYPLAKRSHSSVAIVVPFPEKTLDQVLMNIRSDWTAKLPCTNRNDHMDIIFYTNRDRNKELEEKINDALEQSPQVRRCFGKILFLGAHLLDHEDAYPAGPNHMFCRLIEQDILSKYDYFFYFEPDARPIRPNWSNAIFDQANSAEKFWIKGSVYAGGVAPFEILKYCKECIFHPNGNAIYGIGDPKFKQFARENCVRVFRYGHNYDTSFGEYWQGDYSRWNFTRRNYHKIVYSHFIQNWWKSPYNLLDVLDEFPETYFIHGGFPWINNYGGA